MSFLIGKIPQFPADQLQIPSSGSCTFVGQLADGACCRSGQASYIFHRLKLVSQVIIEHIRKSQHKKRPAPRKSDRCISQICFRRRNDAPPALNGLCTQLIQQAANLPHGHDLHLFGANYWAPFRQLQRGMLFSAGHTQRMSLVQHLTVGSITMRLRAGRVLLPSVHHSAAFSAK